MWRFCILLLIVGNLLYAENINTSIEVSENETTNDVELYTPLTVEQAIAYIDNPNNREQLIKDIIRLDAIEHSPLQIANPQYTALLDKDDNLIIFPQIKDGIVPVYLYDLAYRVKFPIYNIEGFGKGICPKFNFKSFLIGLGTGLLSGVLIGIFAE